MFISPNPPHSLSKTNLRLETETNASYQIFELFDISKTARNFSDFEFSPTRVELN